MRVPTVMLWLCVPLALLVGACGDDDGAMDPDTGPGDAGMIDLAMDSGTDSGTDAGMDAGDGDAGPEDMGDTTAPTLAITDDADGVATGDVLFTLTPSEDIGTSLAAEDVAVVGGSAGAFTPGADGSATLVVTPPAEAMGTLMLSVAAGAFEDLAGNANAEAVTAAQDFDTRSPSTLVHDFEDTPGLRGFAGATAVLAADPDDASNTVLSLTKASDAAFFAGTTMFRCEDEGIAPLPFSATATTMSARVWSPAADIPVRLKVENSAMGAISVETDTFTTVAGAWEVLVFDFRANAMDTPALDFGRTYDKVAVFFDFGATGADVGEARTYFMDDLRFLGTEFDGAACPMATPLGTLPITFDDASLTYQFSPFGGTTGAMVVTDPDDAGNMVAEVTKSATAEGSAGTTFFTGPDESIPVIPLTATATSVTLRVRSPRSGIPVRLKIEEALDPTRSVETEAMTTGVDTWETLTFDFSMEATGTAMLNPAFVFNQVTVFFDFGRSGEDGGGGTFFYDDLTFVP
ncbi:MAG: Ig-like domain-containing protein [Myxococcota bacterium]